MPRFVDRLQPGDCLLYRPDSPLGLWIAVKTWSWVSHCEVYFGNCLSAAARVYGVNLYVTRQHGLGYVLRPKGNWDFTKAQDWFQTVRGQGYDWLGLACFYLAARRGAKDRMFCSELVTRLYRQGGFAPFAEWFDADHVAPAQFLQSPEFEMIYGRRR